MTGGDPAKGPDERFRHLFAVLQGAQEAGDARPSGPGVAAEAIDAAARRPIEAEGFGEAFFHRTGHGIGLEGHEEPYIIAGNDEPLRPGMAFSVEPGIYLVGRVRRADRGHRRVRAGRPDRAQRGAARAVRRRRLRAGRTRVRLRVRQPAVSSSDGSRPMRPASANRDLMTTHRAQPQRPAHRRDPNAPARIAADEPPPSRPAASPAPAAAVDGPRRVTGVSPGHARRPTAPPHAPPPAAAPRRAPQRARVRAAARPGRRAAAIGRPTQARRRGPGAARPPATGGQRRPARPAAGHGRTGRPSDPLSAAPPIAGPADRQRRLRRRLDADERRREPVERPVHRAAAAPVHQEPPVRADARAPAPVRHRRRRRRRDARPARPGLGLRRPADREGGLLGELLKAGEIGYELSLDPRTPIVIGVYPMRPSPRLTVRPVPARRAADGAPTRRPPRRYDRGSAESRSR